MRRSGRGDHVQQLVERLRDARGRRVVFLSHCLLNENTRYLGGACVPGCRPEVLQRCLEGQLGIVQMPCPEQRAWGGVLKRSLLAGYGLKQRWPLLYLIRRPLLALFRWRTRRAYSRLARQVAAEVADYLDSGTQVSAIVGVDGSPTCGVHVRIDLDAAFERVARLPVERLTCPVLNAELRACAVGGDGLFVEALRGELRRKGVDVPFGAHDLLAELAEAAPPPGPQESTGRGR